MKSITLQYKIDTKYINSENSKTTDLLLKVLDEINLQKSDKYVALSDLSIYYTWENIKKSYKNNKFKISTSSWNDRLELPGGSYSR